MFVNAESPLNLGLKTEVATNDSQVTARCPHCRVLVGIAVYGSQGMLSTHSVSAGSGRLLSCRGSGQIVEIIG